MIDKLPTVLAAFAAAPKVIAIGGKLLKAAKENIEAAQALKEKGISGAQREKEAVEGFNATYDTFDEVAGFDDRTDAYVYRNSPRLIAMTYDFLNTFIWPKE